MSRNPRRAFDANGQEILPMRLANARARCPFGRWLLPTHRVREHEATLDVDGLPDDVAVPDVALRLRCTRCGGRDIRTRPDWSEMQAAGIPQPTR